MFESLKLCILDFSDIDWHDVIENQDDDIKPIVLVQSRLAALVSDLDDLHVNPQRIGWMLFWTKAYKTLVSAIVPKNYGRGELLEMLSRSVQEAYLYLYSAIYFSLKKVTPFENLIRDHLSAYTAWCLWKDKEVSERELNRKNMDEVWDQSLRREIIMDPTAKEFHFHIFGSFDQDDDKTVRKKDIGRRKYFLKRFVRSKKCWITLT